jgi:hypothetical protein
MLDFDAAHLVDSGAPLLRDQSIISRLVSGLNKSHLQNPENVDYEETSRLTAKRKNKHSNPIHSTKETQVLNIFRQRLAFPND